MPADCAVEQSSSDLQIGVRARPSTARLRSRRSRCPWTHMAPVPAPKFSASKSSRPSNPPHPHDQPPLLAHRYLQPVLRRHAPLLAQKPLAHLIPIDLRLPFPLLQKL